MMGTLNLRIITLQFVSKEDPQCWLILFAPYLLENNLFIILR